MLYVLDTYRYFVRYNDVFFFILYLLSTILCLSHLSRFISLIGYFCETIRFIISHNLYMIMYEFVSGILIKTKQKKWLQNLNRYKYVIFAIFNSIKKYFFFFSFYKSWILLTWNVHWYARSMRFFTLSLWHAHACMYIHTHTHIHIHDRECVNIIDISTSFLNPLLTIVN